MNAAAMKATRTKIGSMSKYSAMPPHTPAMRLFVSDLVSWWRSMPPCWPTTPVEVKSSRGRRRPLLRLDDPGGVAQW